jgi:hypothetical protein
MRRQAGMVDGFHLKNGFVLAFRQGRDWAKTHMSKGFAHGVNGFVLSKMKKLRR